MKPISREQWHRIEQLLDAALDLPAEQRDAFVREACGADEALRAEVAQLLEGCEGPGVLPDRPAAEFVAGIVSAVGPATPAADPPGPARVGPYRVLSQLGQGGMGAVYLAERDDGQFHQRVALKLVRRGLHLDERLVRRFRDERQILASLVHPHIARLLDGGLTDDGLPYFAMELVEGQPIDRFADAGHLPVAERLELFLKVCDAVEYAHGRHIVHRDLKPSNILVSRTGELKLVDFGIAKLLAPGLESTGLTRTGDRLLTPEYASPEQIRGEPVAPASDVYSLGLVLYELLAGHRPFRRAGRTAHELERAILEEEATRPSATVARPADIAEQISHARGTSPDRLRRRLQGDLDAIVLKALRKEPRARYATAGELGADVRRHLAGEPVRARGGARTYRVRRFLRRHRTAVLTGTAGVALGVAVLAVALPGEDTAGPGEGRKMLAVLPFKNLGPPADEYFADGLTEEITSRLAGLSDLGVVSRTSADQYKGTEKALREIGRELGAGYVLEGSVRWERADSGPGRVRVTPQLIRVADDRHLWAHNYDAELTEVLDVQAAIAERVTTALDLALRAPERAALERRGTANSEAYDYYLRGNDYASRSQSREDAGTALELYQRAVSLDPGFAAAWARLSRMHMGLYWWEYDRSPERRRQGKEAAETALRLAPGLPDAHIALGYYWYWGHLDYDRALEHFNAARATQPSNSELLRGIGLVQRRQGRWEEALATFRTALELDPRSTGRAADLGETYAVVRQYPLAARYLDRAIALAPELPVGYLFRAELEIVARGDTAGARAVLRDALEKLSVGELVGRMQRPGGVSPLLFNDTSLAPALDAVTLDAFSGDSAFYYHYKTELHYTRRDARRARAYADSARAVMEAKLRLHPDDSQLRSRLGFAYAVLGRNAEATREGRRAVALLPISRDALGGTFRLATLAGIYTMIGEPESAIDLLGQLLAVPSWYSVQELRVDPSWDPLRGHPRFQRLVGK